jgi:hypothetical protein
MENDFFAKDLALLKRGGTFAIERGGQTQPGVVCRLSNDDSRLVFSEGGDAVGIDPISAHAVHFVDSGRKDQDGASV